MATPARPAKKRIKMDISVSAQPLCSWRCDVNISRSKVPVKTITADSGKEHKRDKIKIRD